MTVFFIAMARAALRAVGIPLALFCLAAIQPAIAVADDPAAVSEPAPEENVQPKRGAGKSRNAGRYKAGAVDRSPERVFLPGQKNPIVLRANSAELFLLQRLRDEAHRFAITFQRQLRKTANFKTLR